MIVNVVYFSSFWLLLHEVFHALLQTNSSVFVQTIWHYTIQHLKDVESN